MFTRSSKKRNSSRSPTALDDPERGQPCNVCGEQCPGFVVHKWSIIGRTVLLKLSRRRCGTALLLNGAGSACLSHCGIVKAQRAQR
ncbi:hypothetical protein SRHO_G00268790 [Serrasalmus rhombeus]